MLFGGFGHWLVLTYPLEYTLKSDILHYIGVCICLFGTFAALLIQQQCSLFSLFITFITIINVIFFMSLNYIFHFKAKDIHWQSLLMILTESLILIFAAISYCKYVFNLTEDSG